MEQKTRAIYNYKLADYLISKNYTILGIKNNKYDSEKVVYIFLWNEELEKIVNKWKNKKRN